VLITNKRTNTVSFKININGNRIERALGYKHFGVRVLVDDKYMESGL